MLCTRLYEAAYLHGHLLPQTPLHCVKERLRPLQCDLVLRCSLFERLLLTLKQRDGVLLLPDLSVESLRWYVVSVQVSMNIEVPSPFFIPHHTA